jgi:hypothetical protein
MIEQRDSANRHTPVNLLFLGQCLLYGYPGVEDSGTFPRLARSMLTARFPQFDFKFDRKYIYHPRGMRAILQHRLPVTRPDIVVIAVSGIYAASRWRVNMLYEIAPEVIDTARSFLQRIDAKIKGQYRGKAAEKLLDSIFSWHPPIALSEYELLLEEAVMMCRNTTGAAVVLIGPSPFDEDTNEGYALQSPELWRSVNQMVLMLGDRMQVPVLDIQDLFADFGREVIVPGTVKYSRYGHQVVAQEVQRILEAEVAALDPGRS